MSIHNKLKQLEAELSKEIIGQSLLINRLVVALLADGHLLVEGAPGLAKTRSIKALSTGVEGDFHRIQFTPDLLPADLTGTDIYRPQDGSFKFQRGPLFHNLILADEVNRAPAKVQSALLEAMGERQITVGKETYPLPDLFLVMATQNPIEQEGTYSLPEAQLDRFLMHVKVDYPSAQAEKEILKLVRNEAKHGNNEAAPLAIKISQQDLFDARQEVLAVHMSDELEDYLIQIILASRNPEKYGEDIASWVQFGASPRATIALDRCARAFAWLLGRDFVIPEDIQNVAHDILRHRVLLSYEAEAEGVTVDGLVSELLRRVAVP